MSTRDAAHRNFRSGRLGDMVDSLDRPTRDAISADIWTALMPFETAGRVLLDAVALLVTARAAST